MAKIKLWLAFGQRRENFGRHWCLILVGDDPERGTYFHIQGGPSQSRKYEVVIQAKKLFHSSGFSEHHLIAEMDEENRNKVKASAQEIPPERCQQWTVKVLGDLERKDLVPEGTHDHWLKQIEESPFSREEIEAASGGNSGADADAETGSGTASSASKSRKAAEDDDWFWISRRGDRRF